MEDSKIDFGLLYLKQAVGSDTWIKGNKESRTGLLGLRWCNCSQWLRLRVEIYCDLQVKSRLTGLPGLVILLCLAIVSYKLQRLRLGMGQMAKKSLLSLLPLVINQTWLGISV